MLARKKTKNKPLLLQGTFIQTVCFKGTPHLPWAAPDPTLDLKPGGLPEKTLHGWFATFLCSCMWNMHLQEPQKARLTLRNHFSGSCNFITASDQISNYDAVDESKSVLACTWFHFYGFRRVYQTQGWRCEGFSLLWEITMLLYQLCSTPPQKQGQRNHLASVFPER